MNRAKIAAIADLAEGLENDDMALHETCALGVAKRAGLLVPNANHFGMVTTLSASRQLGIEHHRAQNWFLDSFDGVTCADKMRAYLRETAMG